MSVTTAPIKVRSVFNMNNFQNLSDTYLGNKGQQRLYGDLTQNNETTLNDEVVYGTSTTNNLVVNGTATLLSEPTLSSVNTTTLQNNQLVSKAYVTSKLAQIEPNPYPIFFTYGKHFTANGIAPTMANPTAITLGVREPNSVVETGVFECMYQFTKCNANSADPVAFVKYYGTFLVNWTKAGSGGGYVAPESVLVGGDDMRGGLNDYGGIKPIRFGVSQSKPAISVQFPTDTNNINNNGWISSYSISIRIVSSNPVSTTSNFTIKAPMTDGSNSYTGNLYFL